MMSLLLPVTFVIMATMDYVATEISTEMASEMPVTSCSKSVDSTKSNADITMALKNKFDEGLQSTSAPYKAEIEAVACELNISVKRVKDFIGNERNRRKRRACSTKVPPQKIRHVSGYNLFSRNFFKSETAKSIQDKSAQNKACAIEWKNLSTEEQKKFVRQAEEESSRVPDSWKETRRILDNMKANCCWVEKIKDVDAFYVVVHKNETYVGGTVQGQEWLKQNPTVPLSFLSHANKLRLVPNSSNPKSKNDLKKEVDTLLNNKYALTIGKPTSRVPYGRLMKRNVLLSGKEFVLKEPSKMKIDELSFIRDNILHISFTDVPPADIYENPDHDYCKSQEATELPNISSTSHSGSILLSSVHCEEEPLLYSVPAVDIQHAIGSEVNFLNNGKVLGTGIVMGGPSIHCKPIPIGYTKISILDVLDNVEPIFQTEFDDTYLCKNSITVWPSNQICLK